MDLLVSTQWLADEIRLTQETGGNDLKVVDATYFLPETGRDPQAAYEAAHIPGTLYLNLTELVDTTSPLPNMLPSAEQFAASMTNLGLGDGNRIVIYDDSPHRTSARAWWMFNLFGARNIAILDGGLGKWRAEGRALESGIPLPSQATFAAYRDDSSYRTKEQVANAIRTGKEQLVDARSPSRFTGQEPETRAGVASGHIPGAINLPYSHLFHADGTWKRSDDLMEAFASAGVDLDRPIITTCGSGITAATLSFGATLLGAKCVAMYDGSWSEWGADPSLPKSTGPA